MLACIHKLLERLGIIDHVDDTGWNAHGNTATGTASNGLTIDAGTFKIKGNIGDIPAEFSSGGDLFAYIPSKRAFHVGRISPYTPGLDAVVIGYNSTATASGSVALGYDTDCSATQGIAIGANCLNGANIFGTAIGFNARLESAANAGVALGTGVTATAQGAVVVGTGTGFGSGPFVNNIANSMALGANINTGLGDNPTLFLYNKRCGVEHTDPKSTLDIKGSVGAQYNNIGYTSLLETTVDTPTSITTDENHNITNGETVRIAGVSGGNYVPGINGDHVATVVDSTTFTVPVTCNTEGTLTSATVTPVLNGNTKTIDSTENEYTFTIDLKEFGSGDQYTINLPQISGIDRRIYYFKVITTDIVAPSLSGGLTGLVLHPYAGDALEKLSSGAPSGVLDTADIVINCGDAVTISANLDTGAWWIV